MTTERWTEKPSWFERGSLAYFVDTLPTRIHKLEQRAMNEKARGLRAEAKALRLHEDHEAGDQMICQLCGRLIRSKHGVIAHHGYTRPGGGWQTASCDGTHHSPLEVSNLHLLDTIADFEKRRETESRRIENVEEEREPVIVWVKPHWRENRRYPYVFEFTRQTYDAVRAATACGRRDVRRTQEWIRLRADGRSPHDEDDPLRTARTQQGLATDA